MLSYIISFMFWWNNSFPIDMFWLFKKWIPLSFWEKEKGKSTRYHHHWIVSRAPHHSTVISFLSRAAYYKNSPAVETYWNNTLTTNIYRSKDSFRLRLFSTFHLGTFCTNKLATPAKKGKVGIFLLWGKIFSINEKKPH